MVPDYFVSKTLQGVQHAADPLGSSHCAAQTGCQKQHHTQQAQRSQSHQAWLQPYRCPSQSRHTTDTHTHTTDTHTHLLASTQLQVLGALAEHALLRQIQAAPEVAQWVALLVSSSIVLPEGLVLCQVGAAVGQGPGALQAGGVNLALDVLHWTAHPQDCFEPVLSYGRVFLVMCP